jgi:hypothetical protein
MPAPNAILAGKVAETARDPAKLLPQIESIRPITGGVRNR